MPYEKYVQVHKEKKCLYVPYSEQKILSRTDLGKLRPQRALSDPDN